MINVLYEPFPDTVNVSGRKYSVVTDFRDWLMFSDMLGDKSIPELEKLAMLTNWLKEPVETVNKDLVSALCDFYRANELNSDIHNTNDEDTAHLPHPPVLDWKTDAKFIIGDFLRYYHIDLLSAEMHWWRFRILLAALPDESQIMKRIAYRSADLGQIKNEAERKRVMRMKQIYALPFEYDDEDIGAVFGGTM